MNSEPSPLWLYAPLWGVDFDSDETGLVGGNAFAATPYSDEWESLQRWVVADERQRIAAATRTGAAIPLCLSIAARHPGQDLGSAIQEHHQQLITELRRSVLALRLHHAGWFLDPELAEICFVINDQRSWMQRQPGPYRQSFLVPDSLPPFPRYRLKIADLSRTREESSAVTMLWNQLADVEQVAGVAPLSMALDYFGRSYGYQSTVADRLAFLFMAGEALLGGLTGVAPGEIELHGPGARYYRRLKAALIKQGLDAVTCGREAAWVLGDEPGEGRWLRNRVAHGDPIEDQEGKAQWRLQAIIRALMRCALDFYCRWSREASELSTSLNIRSDALPIGAFNAWLAAATNAALAKG